HYYMGAVIAEKLALMGKNVTLVTPAADVSSFTINTLENIRTAKRLYERGVGMVTHMALTGTHEGQALFVDARTGATSHREIEALVLVTARLPRNELFEALTARLDRGDAGRLRRVSRIGDCEAPAAIYAAVYSGHRFAQEFENGHPTLRRERINLAS
ncbi:NADH:flavin oxidoreductase, partial [Mesorhizobium sp. M7A.F.Ca.ET.027.03.2.1]